MGRVVSGFGERSRRSLPERTPGVTRVGKLNMAIYVFAVI